MGLCPSCQGAAAHPDSEEQQQRLREAAEGLRMATNAAAQNAIKKKLVHRLEVSFGEGQSFSDFVLPGQLFLTRKVNVSPGSFCPARSQASRCSCHTDDCGCPAQCRGEQEPFRPAAARAELQGKLEGGPNPILEAPSDSLAPTRVGWACLHHPPPVEQGAPGWACSRDILPSSLLAGGG